MVDKKLNDLGIQLEASLNKLVHLMALGCGLAKITAHIDMKLLKLWPHKTMNTVIHSLLPSDCKARLCYCTWFQELVFSGLLSPYSKKSRFILSGYVSNQADGIFILFLKCHCFIMCAV
jgi:hypothetical protein